MSEAWIKQAALSVGDGLWSAAGWVGGTLAGEFSQKRTTGQIVVDAVISMFPIAGEVTAARDATAISLRMSESEEARENVWEWVTLVLCLLAIVPVLGGVLKGVGKLLMRAVSKSEDLVKLCAEIAAWLTKCGIGNAKNWLRELDFAKYQEPVLKGFNELIERVGKASKFIVGKLGSVLPDKVLKFLQALPPKLEELKALGASKIPEAFKELNSLLERVRLHIVDGTWADVTVGGGRVRVMTEEARLAELAVDAGKSLGHLPATRAHFKPKDGWPDLRDFAIPKGIGTFSIKASIEAITHKPGEVMVRILDTAQLADRWHLPGRFWTTYLPENGAAWRIKCAVKHFWNKNGKYASMKVPTAQEMRDLGVHVPADWEGMRLWKGQIGQQWDDEGDAVEATLRLLTGGDIQYFVDFNNAYNKPVLEWIDKKVHAMSTNWKDTLLPSETKAKALLLAERERSAKIRQEGYAFRGAASTGKVVSDQATADNK